MLKSIYHDIPEAITGDIITPTKKSVEWFEEVLEKPTEMPKNMTFEPILTLASKAYKLKTGKLVRVKKDRSNDASESESEED